MPKVLRQSPRQPLETPDLRKETDNPFGSSLPIYTFKNVCMEDRGIVLEDDATKVIVNAEGDTKDANAEVKALLEYIKSKKVEGAFVEDLNNAVNDAIDHREWRDEYMTFAMRLNEEKAIGRAEGRAEERDNNLNTVIQNLMSREGLSLEAATEKAKDLLSWRD